MRRAPRLTTLAAATTLVAACTDVSAGADEPFQIAFDTLPAVAVVAGDTMRDTLGAAAPLRAEVYNSDGDLIENADVAFIPTVRGEALRTVNDVLPNDYAIARPDTFAEQVQLVALAGSLQSVSRAIDVVRAPTLLRAEGSTLLDLDYRVGIDTASSLLRVRVGWDSAGTFKGVKSWLVRWHVVYPATTPTDTSTAAFIVADSTSLRRTRLDTTAADGLASRAVRLRPARLTSEVDSIVVEARATYRAELLGSPVRFVVRFRPRT